MTIAEALISAAARLDAAGIAEPRREASSILSFILDRPASYLIAHPEYTLDPREAAALDAGLARRERREPFQYISGRQEFWGLEFDVGPGVLIPRPETEILVEAAVEFLRTCSTPRFAEAGVGSGCISVSILYSVHSASGVATDLSTVALDTAARNAAKHGVRDRLDLREADLLDHIDGPFDLVASNPPYISDADIATLQPEVRDYEPHSALSGGEDGLALVRRIVYEARHKLRAGGVLLMEIGDGQADAVGALFDVAQWRTPEFYPDLQSIPRVVSARLA